MRLVCATWGSLLLFIFIIIISTQETIKFPVPWQYEAYQGNTGGSLFLFISIIIISTQETIIFPVPGNMRLVWATGGSHLLLSIYYNHLQSTNHYIPWPLDTWGLSGRHGGLTSFFYLLLSSPINKSLYSQPPGNLRPVWATRGSHLLLLSIIIISNQEIIIFPAPWQY